jgi:hypothetical protein
VKNHVDKIVASFLITLSAAFMALWTVFRDWAVYPPRLGLRSAVLVPLGHIGMRAGLPDTLVLVLACFPFVALGVYLSHGWIRGNLRRAALISAPLYGLAVAAAFLAGIKR